LVSSMARPAVAAFDSSGRRLYAVDSDQQQVWFFDSGAAVRLTSLAEPNAPAVSPVGAVVTVDGQYLLLVDSAAREVRILETGSGALANTLPLSFTPTRFEPLSNVPTFLLNGDRRNEWLLLLDASQTAHLSFVPASQEEVQ